jgi:hypothetical protein
VLIPNCATTRSPTIAQALRDLAPGREG